MKAADDRGAGDPAPASSSPAPGPGEEEASLHPREEDFLRELGAAASKFSIYPPGHPTLEPAVEELQDRLSAALEEADVIVLEVRRDRLLVDGATTDPENPLLRNLSKRLHDHQLDSLAFRAGVSREELLELLELLSREDIGEDPLGLSDQAREWSHLVVRGRRYDPMRLDEEGAGPATADAPPAAPASGGGRDGGDHSATVRGLEEKLTAGAPDSETANRILELTRELEEAGGEEEARARLSRIMVALPSEDLEYFLRLYGENGKEESFLSSAARSLELDATMKLVRAAAARRDDDIAEWLLELVLRMSAYDQEAPARDRADGAETTEEVVDRILEDWELDDPRPSRYRNTLHRMARTPPEEAGMSERRARAVFLDPERVLKMGLELDEGVGCLLEAADQMVESHRVDELADLLEQAEEENELAEELWDRLATGEVVTTLLQQDDPDYELLERLVRRAGARAAPALLDVVAPVRRPSGERWRRAFRLLVELGEPVAELAAGRLEDDRAHVRRNLLALLRELPSLPEDVAPLDLLLEDPAPEVRVEALKLALVRSDDPKEAALAALDDPDPRVVGEALSAVESRRAPDVDGALSGLVSDPEHTTSHRIRAARLLAESEAPEALKALLDIVWVRRWFFWRRLAPKGALMLAALRALARGWSDAPEARKALREAREAEDREVRAAARGERRSGGRKTAGAAGAVEDEGSASAGAVDSVTGGNA